MLVMKFGGSSVKDSEMFQKVAEIVVENSEKRPVVVQNCCLFNQQRVF